MDVLKPLDDSDSVFLLLTKRLNLMKFHELLNKIQEFMAGLREEDLTDTTLKELTVKRDATGRQSVLLNYNPVPQPKPQVQVQAQTPPQTQQTPPQAQPQSQPQPQQQIQPQISQVQAPTQPQVQPQVQIQVQPQPQLPIQQQQPKPQQTQPQIQPQIQINHPQKQAAEPYYQTQTLQYEGPQPVKKVKMDQPAHNEMNNGQATTLMDNGGYPQQKYNAMKPELSRTQSANYGNEYDEYVMKENWRSSSHPSSHGHTSMSHTSQQNQPNFANPFRGSQQYPPINTLSAISTMSTLSTMSTISAMNTEVPAPRNKSMNYYQEDPMPPVQNVANHHSETPKFPNQHTLAAYVEKIWKESPILQGNNDMAEVERGLNSNFNSNSQKTIPVFESTFVKIDPPNFYIDAVKPGLVSKKLSQALGMASEKEAPPYLSKLLKVGLPDREEPFYGINAKVPKDFDKESFLKAGVSPSMFESSEKMEVIPSQDNQNKKGKDQEGAANLPGVLSDTDYLERFLRKPQSYVGKSGAPLKTIEIDD